MELAQDCVQRQAFLLVALNLLVLLPGNCQLGYLVVNSQNPIPSKDKNFTLCHQIQTGYEANLSYGCLGLFHQPGHSTPRTKEELYIHMFLHHHGI
jgi:hypothetical protein